MVSNFDLNRSLMAWNPLEKLLICRKLCIKKAYFHDVIKGWWWRQIPFLQKQNDRTNNYLEDLWFEIVVTFILRKQQTIEYKTQKRLPWIYISGRWQAPRSTRKTNSEGIARRAMTSARRAESSWTSQQMQLVFFFFFFFFQRPLYKNVVICKNRDFRVLF